MKPNAKQQYAKRNGLWNWKIMMTQYAVSIFLVGGAPYGMDMTHGIFPLKPMSMCSNRTRKYWCG